MLPEMAIAVVAAFTVSALLTSRMRTLALSKGLLDVPNERSSHKLPTPRGGGVAIALTTTAALVVLALTGILPTDEFWALFGGGTMVAVVGFLDDGKQLSARLRLAVHFAAACWALGWIGGLPDVRIGEQVVSLGWSGYLLGSLGIVWTLNLFNFMDGVDGIAASEAMFVSWGGALLALMIGVSVAIPMVALIFGAACCGFLVWNWPPAKIFMGDAGSGFLGYVIAVLAICVSRESSVGLVVWLILGGTFFVDATVTLARRMIRGERLYEAHRSHAYQWLARRWQSHKRVTLTFMGINVIWLFPCSLLATLHSHRAWWILLLALTPVAIAVVVAGAGRREETLNRSGSV